MWPVFEHFLTDNKYIARSDYRSIVEEYPDVRNTFAILVIISLKTTFNLCNNLVRFYGSQSYLLRESQDKEL